MTLGQKQEQMLLDMIALVKYANSKGLTARLREVQRTPEQQELYYNMGKSNTLKSKHINSLAFDMYFFDDGVMLSETKDLEHVGDFWESLRDTNKWGGHWKTLIDTPHFETD